MMRRMRTSSRGEEEDEEDGSVFFFPFFSGKFPGFSKSFPGSENALWEENPGNFPVLTSIPARRPSRLATVNA